MTNSLQQNSGRTVLVHVASGAVVLLYMITAEAAKAAFYKDRGRQGTERGRARVTRPFLAVR